jgi:hypothetical protein
MPGFSSTHSSRAFSGGFKYSPTISSSLAWNSGSGLKVKVRIRCSCNSCAVGQTYLSCQRTYSPTSLRLRLLAGQGLHVPPHLGIILGRSTGPTCILQSLQSLQSKRTAPFTYRHLRDAQVRCDLLIRSTGRGGQNDATAER